MLVCALVLSKLDYHNALLSGCDKKFISKLERVQKSAARLIFRVKKREHTSPLLIALHWLPIEARIEYKLCSMCFNFFNGTAPGYFDDLLTKYVCRREGNRSNNDNRTLVNIKKNLKTVSFGERSFAYCGPRAWNSLPFEVRHKLTFDSFKRALKTFLFQKFHSP